MVVEDVWLGYIQVILKSDHEPAIMKFLQAALVALKESRVDQASEEHPPPYHSQANGGVEAAAKQERGRFNTLKLCFQRRIGKRNPPKHHIVAWLVAHCAALARYRLRGADGKTPYERVRMRPFGKRLPCFAEERRRASVAQRHIPWHVQ